MGDTSADRPSHSGDESQRSAIDTVRAYHEATKHRLNAYAPGPGFLDWDCQPDPFRRWPDAALFQLPLVDGTGQRTYQGLYQRDAQAGPLTDRSLGLFLELALGLSTWKHSGADRWALRNNPSSGNLHPTEIYVLLWRAVSAGIGPGLYHYAPFEHALECRARLPEKQARVLTRSHPEAFGAIAFSSIVWREAWKYGARAYRYCQLDVGHALGAARYAAATLGWTLQLDPACGDDSLGNLLGLVRVEDFGDVEPEHPEAIALLGERVSSAPDWRALARELTGWQGRASRISVEHVDWPQITRVLPAAVKPDHPGQGVWRAMRTPAVEVPVDTSVDAAALIRSRRSAQHMDGITGIRMEILQRALMRTLPTSDVAPFDAWPYQPAIHLMLFVHDVAGLDPGLYALVRHPARLKDLRTALRAADFEWTTAAQDGLPLYRLRASPELRPIASRLSCHQGIAGRGAFAVAMLADLRHVMETEGAWAWRRLHWEAGLIGQVLYLEAEANGLRGTGIGCFFDDDVHALLGLEAGARASWQVLYHFTVGRALDDERLTGEPPYAHLGAEQRAQAEP
jgi:SagB-type dehydrogenase family enzyme